MLKFYLPHRKEGEKIILLLRRHRFIILTKIAFWTIVALMPLALYLILGQELQPFLSHELISPIVVLFISIYYLYIWLFAFHSFVDYYLDVWIVTDHRVINIEQKGLFNRVISEQELYRIQDVTSQFKGIFSTMLNFGTVFIQTAGEHPRFIFKQIPNPHKIARKIIKLVEQNKKFRSVMQGKDKITT